jgi:hypothetical protein
MYPIIRTQDSFLGFCSYNLLPKQTMWSYPSYSAIISFQDQEIYLLELDPRTYFLACGPIFCNVFVETSYVGVVCVLLRHQFARFRTPWLSVPISPGGMNNRPVGGRSSET